MNKLPLPLLVVSLLSPLVGAETQDENESIAKWLKAGEEAYYSRKYEEALDWYSKAAELGNTEALRILSEMYYDGDGVPEDIQKSGDWLRKASLLGDMEASFMLAAMFDMGDFGDGPSAWHYTVAWYLKAAEQGHPVAQSEIGDIYHRGRGDIKKDHKKALAWYQKAAEQGHRDSALSLAYMYKDGTGVPKSDEHAAEWFTKAAEQGQAQAQSELVSVFTFGRGVPKDYVAAMKWCLIAEEIDRSQLQGGTREALSGFMTKEQVAEAKISAAEWIQKFRKYPLN